jgi:hypothetical protein
LDLIVFGWFGPAQAGSDHRAAPRAVQLSDRGVKGDEKIEIDGS